MTGSNGASLPLLESHYILNELVLFPKSLACFTTCTMKQDSPWAWRHVSREITPLRTGLASPPHKGHGLIIISHHILLDQKSTRPKLTCLAASCLVAGSTVCIEVLRIQQQATQGSAMPPSNYEMKVFKSDPQKSLGVQVQAANAGGCPDSLIGMLGATEILQFVNKTAEPKRAPRDVIAGFPDPHAQGELDRRLTAAAFVYPKIPRNNLNIKTSGEEQIYKIEFNTAIERHLTTPVCVCVCVCVVSSLKYMKWKK